MIEALGISMVNSLLTLPTQYISGSCIKIKLISISMLLCGASKGFIKSFKAFTKSSEAPQKKCENKNLSKFSLFVRDRDRKG